LTNTVTVPGKYGSAQQFNGTSSRMTIPTFNITTGAFTLEGWVNFMVLSRRAVPTAPTPTTASGWSAIIYKGLDNFYLAEQGGFLTAGFTKSTGQTIQIVRPTTMTVAGWHHVAATH